MSRVYRENIPPVVWVHGRDRVKVIATDYVRALVEFSDGNREWIVYGVLMEKKGEKP